MYVEDTAAPRARDVHRNESEITSERNDLDRVGLEQRFEASRASGRVDVHCVDAGVPCARKGARRLTVGCDKHDTR
jgi:hypothetical protein